MTADMETLARTGDLGDRRLRAYLDTLPLGDVMGLLGSGEVEPVIQQTRWHPGDGRPALADEDPAVVCAIARCWLARWRKDPRFGRIASSVAHPDACGWCDYPAAELLRVLEWAGHHGQFITDEWMVWFRRDAVYRRPTGRAGTYANPRWHAFGAMTPSEQRSAVDEAVRRARPGSPTPEGPTSPNAGPRGDDASGVASGVPVGKPEAPPAVLRAHDPWCDLPADHAGDCPEPEATDDQR